jgi:crotonobetainyl-CoA:carnitine CoA-transferase CaiB-like acyl-CoA transferase
MFAQAHPAGALAGVRVLDATQMLAGPLCGMRLGDLGADVIKVERPGTGEFNRTHGFEGVTVDGEMTTFLAVNRNKRSAAIDVKHPEGRQALLDLARNSDVLIQNFRRGTAERLGLGYEDLAAVNPRLVYCSISGYGVVGPYRDRPGQDLVIQGYSGSMFSVGAKDDPPLPGALWAADVMTGYQAAIGILAALEARHRTGRGQHVEVDMLSVVLDAQVQELVTYLNSGKSPTRTAQPTAHASIPAPYGVYRTADGWLTIAMSPLSALGDALNDDVLRGMSEYDDGHTRKDEAYARLRGAFVSRPTEEWIQLLDGHGVWCGPVYDYEDLVADPHVREAGLIAEQPNAAGGNIRTVRVPVSLSETPAAIRRGAPSLGADTAQILAQVAGYDDDRVDLLAREGAIAVSDLASR